MFNFLIYLGIIAIPYTQLLHYYGREPKLMLSTVIALSLGLFSKSSLKFNNVWFSIFFVYCLFAQWQALKPTAVFNNINGLNFYIWRPLFIWLSYYIGFTALSSNRINKDRILDCLIIVCAIMGFHCLIQAANLDQFFITICGTDNQKAVSGFIGNPTLVAPYLAMIVPLAIYRRRFVCMTIMIMGIIVTLSHVGIGALVVSLVFYLCCHKRVFILPTIALGAILLGVMVYDYYHPFFAKHIFDDSGRLHQWKDILNQIVTPIYGKRFFCTGFGIDTFKYMYQKPLEAPYIQAHCEYLEMLYEIGIYGLILFITMFFNLFKSIGIRKENYHLYASLLCIALVAGGTFPFHIGPIAFNSMLILGLLNNRGGLECH